MNGTENSLPDALRDAARMLDDAIQQAECRGDATIALDDAKAVFAKVQAARDTLGWCRVRPPPPWWR